MGVGCRDPQPRGLLCRYLPPTCSLKTSTVTVGHARGHLSLVKEMDNPSFSARAASGGEGCAVLRVSKSEYARLLRKREERLMSDAVRRLGRLTQAPLRPG